MMSANSVAKMGKLIKKWRRTDRRETTVETCKKDPNTLRGTGRQFRNHIRK